MMFRATGMVSLDPTGDEGPNLWSAHHQFGENPTFFIIGFPPSFGAWQ